MLKYWNPREAGTSISMISSKYDETLNVRSFKTGCNIWHGMISFALIYFQKLHASLVSANDVFSLTVALKTEQHDYGKDWCG